MTATLVAEQQGLQAAGRAEHAGLERESALRPAAGAGSRT